MQQFSQFINNQISLMPLYMRNVIRTFILLLSFVTLSHIPFFAQNLIKGEVIDAGNGEPLIGANIIVKNNDGIGTVTDFDGTFELKVGKLPVTLNVSYIGYISIDYEVT
ncbi:MAG: carboxypeptidase-like regulatory domain-containing protein, partial [Saprospiraceae bacterium]